MKRIFAMATAACLLATAGAASLSARSDLAAQNTGSFGITAELPATPAQAERLQAKFRYWASSDYDMPLAAR